MAGADLHAMVLAGGGGTRFWPASRGGTPKQCLRLMGDETLLEATLARVAPLTAGPATIVVTEELAPAIAAAAGKFAHRLVLEPAARNTAAAVALALWKLHGAGIAQDAVVAVLPADHFVGDAEKFRNDLKRAVAVARTSGDLVVFGIPPTRPDTGYGYAEAGAPRSDGARAVTQFHEKPDTATAERYLASGKFFWNAGIFVATVGTLVAELQKYAPDLWAAVGTKDLAAAYAALPSVPFDIALVEKTQRRALIEATFPWSDVGTWSAVAEALEGRADAQGNLQLGAAKTAVAFENARGCVVSTETLSAVGVLGLENVVVAEKDGRLLVASLADSQRVKDVAARLDAPTSPAK